ncbi:hypothetical protein HNR19_003472 [Nocardioides thalensis]|uniref:Uncharacterized protein n=1 Tax=Nocardioides thalensis TaxID=1914755 RepID=A0A853C5M3_9ACTN|nr:hypothetical protein [Nocardioides thalensis]NYJ02774.1 hypothetical protein [Nocardioides thalensis]
MRESTRRKIIDRVGLEANESVRFLSFIMAQNVQRAATLRNVVGAGKQLLPRAAMNAEAFVVVTDRRVVIVDKNPFTLQPTKEIVAELPLADASTEFKRGAMPTVFVWMPDGQGLALRLGKLWTKRAEELAKAVHAERI